MTITISGDIEFRVAAIMEDVNRRLACGADEQDIVIVVSRGMYAELVRHYMGDFRYPLEAEYDHSRACGKLYGFDVYIIYKDISRIDSTNCLEDDDAIFVAYRSGATYKTYFSDGDYVLWDDDSLYVVKMDEPATGARVGTLCDTGIKIRDNIAETATYATTAVTSATPMYAVNDVIDARVYAADYLTSPVYTATSTTSTISDIDWGRIFGTTWSLNPSSFSGAIADVGFSERQRKRARKAPVKEQEMQESPELEAFLQTFRSGA